MIATGTLEKCKLPPGKKAFGTTWVFKQKFNADGTKDRKKARLTARGDQQISGVDFNADSIFAPVLCLEDLRSLLAFAAAHNLEIVQMDVDAAFLQAPLKNNEEVYIKQPEGFVDPSDPDAVYRVRNGMYGLRQANRGWSDEEHEFLISLGFKQVSVDPCVYVLEREGQIVVIGLYVDDNTIVGHKKLIAWVKKKLSSRFLMKDLGPAKSLLGIEILRDRDNGTISLKQSGFIKEILTCYGMDNCNPCATPMETGLRLEKLTVTPNECLKFPYREAIGKLQYVALGTRPDIAFAINYLSRFMSAWNETHWKSVLRVLRYLKGKQDFGIVYLAHTDNPLVLHGSGDANWGGILWIGNPSLASCSSSAADPSAGEYENNKQSPSLPLKPNASQQQRLQNKLSTIEPSLTRLASLRKKQQSLWRTIKERFHCS